MKLTLVIAQLKAERARIDAAIQALQGSVSSARRGKLSAAARAKIAKAQRERWRKWKAQQKGK